MTRKSTTHSRTPHTLLTNTKEEGTTTTNTTNTNNTESKKSFCSRLWSSVVGMGQVPSSLWVVFVLQVLESFAYFSVSLSMVLYLSVEFGMEDSEAGWYYGAVGVLISLYGLLTGPLIDILGVRRSVVIGAVITAVGRFLFATTKSRSAIYWSGMLFMPFGMALGIPVLTIAVKRYTSDETRSFAFGLFYMVMNVAALLSGPATDLCNSFIPEDGTQLFGYHITALRGLFLIATVATVLQIIVACFLRDLSVNDSGEVSHFDPMKQTQSKSNCTQGLVDTFKDKRFWRLVVFSFVLLGARTIFRHVDATMPKWMRRELGEKALYGSVYSINPALIIPLVPIISATTKHWNSYSMITYGAAVSASAAFWLCVDSAYWNSVVFMIQLSIGEAFYSPKVYEYSMQLAPKGKEGMYTVLSSVPLFAAKFVVGGMSGILLAEYCPEHGPRQCWLMWLFISLTSVSSPILLVLLRGWIDVRTSVEVIDVTDHDTTPHVEDGGSIAEDDQEGIQLQLRSTSALDSLQTAEVPSSDEDDGIGPQFKRSK